MHKLAAGIARGFTLIELMIVVAIIGILASVALTSYSQYTIRARVTELVIAGSSFKITIAEKWQIDYTLASAGVRLTVTTSGRITGGSISTAGVITILGTNTSVGTAVTVLLTPVPTGERLSWLCSTNGNTAMWAYVPTECRH
ncbi:MAG: prepilin-type N-terminal cleavage/methylation domain-containing protein [Betaproteobacteria bacterium]|nr:prepilin-type N-terminal cleavage/methylation domain-containing protein [Betaproteobacteria bacterium]